MNTRWSAHGRTKILALNARIWFGAHDGLDMNARKYGHILFRSRMVWTYLSSNARKTLEKFWTHDSLDISTFRLGRSGHRPFPSGPVWTYPLWVAHLNLGSSAFDNVEYQFSSTGPCFISVCINKFFSEKRTKMLCTPRFSSRTCIILNLTDLSVGIITWFLWSSFPFLCWWQSVVSEY